MHNGAMICSIATLTAGIDVKPNDSPQPTTPLSVVTLTNSESTVLRSLSPHAPTSDFPPAVNGMRKAIASMCSIFMSMRRILRIARPRGNPRESAFSLPRRGRIVVPDRCCECDAPHGVARDVQQSADLAQRVALRLQG